MKFHNGNLTQLKLSDSTLTTDCQKTNLWGNCMKLLKKLLNRKKPKPQEPFFEWVETPEEKQERLKQKYSK